MHRRGPEPTLVQKQLGPICSQPTPIRVVRRRRSGIIGVDGLPQQQGIERREGMGITGRTANRTWSRAEVLSAMLDVPMRDRPLLRPRRPA